MVKPFKPPSLVSGSRSLAGSENSGVGGGSVSRRGDVCKDKDEDQTYCVVLHVVEAINFCGRDGENEQIVMNAALNTVDFEIEGQPSATSETIIFNSNCIWECDMAGIKRIKTDHRPVKVTFYSCASQTERKTIGTLLLPVRGLPVLNSAGSQTALQLKMFWHKLICTSNEYRSHKPEVLLTLAIIKKCLLHTKDFEHLMQFANRKSPASSPLQSPGHSITANMLHSQANVYVQSLVQLGLLQVGNDPLIDCDIIEVVLQLKQLKNVCKLVKSSNLGREVGTVLLVFDFVGNVTNIELKLNEKDSYVLNDVLGLRFKSSLRSMRLYFQRIFYLPINMYINGTAVANYRMDFGKLMPLDTYFDNNRKYVHNGSFTFNRLGRADSARESKPMIEYTFSVDVKSIGSRQSQQGQVDDEMQPSISSASSDIRELPLEHQHPEEGSKSRQQQDNCSDGSLNVGAELSASDNDDAGLDPDLPLDTNNSDKEAPKNLPKNQGRRMKFTRLTTKDDSPDSDEDVCVVKKFSSMVVRQPLMAVREDSIDSLTSASEDDVKALYSNQKFNKENPDLEEITMESKKQKPPLKTKESTAKLERQKTIVEDLRKNGKSELDKGLDSEQMSKTKMKSIKKIKSDKSELYKEYPTKEDIRKELETAKESTKGQKMKLELNKEYTPNELQMRGKSIKCKKTQPIMENMETYNESVNEVDMVEERKIIKPKPRPQLVASQSEDKVLRNARKLEEINAADLQQLPKMESILARKERMRREKLEIIRKKSNQLTERDEEEATAESENSLAYIPSRCTRGYSRDDDCAKRTESHMDFFNREVISELRRKKFEGQKDISLLDASDPNLDDSLLLNVLQKESKRKLKPQVLPNDLGELSTANPKELKRNPRAPKSEMALSARWVEVNRHQEEIIKENEKYIEQISNSSEIIEKKRIKRTKVKPTNSKENNMEEFSTSGPVKRTKSKQPILDEEQDQDRSYQLEKSEEHLNLNVRDSGPVKRTKSKQLILEEHGQDQSYQLENSEEFNLNVRETSLLKRTKSKQPIWEEEQDLDSSYQLEKSEEHPNLNVKDSGPVKRTKSKQPLLNKELLDQSYYLENSEEYMNLKVIDSQSTLTNLMSSAELVEEELYENKPTKRIVRKKIIRKSEIKMENPNNSMEFPESQEDVPFKKNLTKKTSRKLTEPSEQLTNDAENVSSKESVQNDKPKKLNRKKSSDMVDCQDANAIDIDMASWTKQQMELFEEELQSKMDEMAMEEQSEHVEQSGEAQSETNLNYERKFLDLEKHVATLKLEMEQQVDYFRKRNQVMSEENTQLRAEKSQLEDHVSRLEQEIKQLSQKKNTIEVGQDLKQVLNELAKQNKRIIDLAKEKDRYKRQWRRSAKKMHNLKLSMYERNREFDHGPNNLEETGKINLKSILTKDAVEFEREYGQYRHPRSVPSFPISTESDEFSLAFRQTMSDQSSQR